MLKNQGFSLVDATLALAILAIVTMMWFKNNATIYHQHQARQLAEQTRNYANLFVSYTIANKPKLTASTSSTTPLIISLADVMTSDLRAIGIATTNLLGQIPCMSLVKNPLSGDLTGIMYYVESRFSTTLAMQYLQQAVLSLGGIGADYNGVDATAGGWQIRAAAIYIINAQRCVTGYHLAVPSIVVNLNAMPAFSQRLAYSTALTRTLDQKESLGRAQNTNTLQTDVSMTTNTGLNHTFIMNSQ